MTAPARRAVMAVLIPGLAVLAGGCGLVFQEEGSPRMHSAGAGASGPTQDTAGLPAGEGTLRQTDISVYLRRGELQMRVTPLDETIIRTAAPDLYEQLSALGGGHQRIFRERTGTARPFTLFLVAVHSEAIQVEFEPQDLTLVSRGIRHRPVDIRALTPNWTRQWVAPRETLMAVYAFPPEVDLESALEVEYREIRDRSWEEVLSGIRLERNRIRQLRPGR
jgi:hypothetical protein